MNDSKEEVKAKNKWSRLEQGIFIAGSLFVLAAQINIAPGYEGTEYLFSAFGSIVVIYLFSKGLEIAITKIFRQKKNRNMIFVVIFTIFSFATWFMSVVF